MLTVRKEPTAAAHGPLISCEWAGATAVPRKVVHFGMAVIVIATLIITYGNYIGE